MTAPSEEKWPDLPERIYLALTGPEQDEISPAFLIDSDLKRARYADVPTVEYFPLETIRERLLDNDVIAAVRASRDEREEDPADHRDENFTGKNCRGFDIAADLRAAIAAAFKEDTEQ